MVIVEEAAACFSTPSGARLQYQSSAGTSLHHWLFLPGGPGLGSEALAGLTRLFKDKIPGEIWHLDLPNDGSNRLNDQALSHWRPALIEAVCRFEKTILVAHSSLGMYAQTVPELEHHLQGLVLMSSAPDTAWQSQFAEYCAQHPDPATDAANDAYEVPTAF